MADTKTLMEHKTNLEIYSLELMKLVNGLQEQTLADGESEAIEETEVTEATNAIMMLTPCRIWECIREALVGSCNSSRGILDLICDELREVLCHDKIKNCELKKQLIRALRLCECLEDAIKNTSCNDDLGELVGRLFCLLVQIILLVVSIIAKIIILIIFCSGRCGNNIFANCDNGEVLSSFCKCLICDLEKELDDIEDLIDELNRLAIIFVTHSAKQCKCNKNDYYYWGDCNCFNNENYLGYENNQTRPTYDCNQNYINPDYNQNYMNAGYNQNYMNPNYYQNYENFNQYDDRKKCNDGRVSNQCKCHRKNKCCRN